MAIVWSVIGLTFLGSIVAGVAHSVHQALKPANRRRDMERTLGTQITVRCGNDSLWVVRDRDAAALTAAPTLLS